MALADKEIDENSTGNRGSPHSPGVLAWFARHGHSGAAATLFRQSWWSVHCTCYGVLAEPRLPVTRVENRIDMTVQWIDRTAGVAYVSVRPLWAFREFLSAVDRLLADPHWRPGMPIVEDLRDADGPPPPNCVEEWRAYLRTAVNCWPAAAGRWSPGHQRSALEPVLETTASDARESAVIFQLFRSMTDAHVWLTQSGGHTSATYPVMLRGPSRRL